MITERIHRATTRLKLSRDQRPRSAMGRAIDYTLTKSPMLTAHLEVGRIEIDDNRVERAIGKKNWLFISEAEAG